MQKKISAVIICQNEEKKIAGCLESVRWADEILIVEQRQWTFYPDQLKFGVDNTKHDWIIFIDADERISSELRDEIAKNLGSERTFDGYYIPRKTYYAKKLLRFWRKSYTLRLFNKSKAHIYYDRVAHERIVIQGEISYLKNYIEHYTYDNLDEYFQRFSYYSSVSAKQLYKRNPDIGTLEICLKMVFEPLAEFIRRFFLKLGFLGGVPVFIMSVMSAAGKFVINVKYWEIKQNQKG
jgi:glycosyltransferase involved in cell wall biosynthesis